MNDEQYRELLEASWQRQLTADELTQLRAYLLAHPQAQLQWEQETLLTQQLDHLPNAPVPSNFTAQVLGQLDLQLAPHRSPITDHRSLITRWWRRLLPRFASILLLALLTGSATTAVVQYRKHQRTQIVHSVTPLTPVAAVVQPDILRDFEAIQQLRHVPLPPSPSPEIISDQELLAAFQ